MSDRRFELAVQRAAEDANELRLSRPDGVARAFHVAIGDPQASLSQFLRILDLNGLLGDDGRIRSDIGLVSMGDHFDWGRPEDRAQATTDGTRLLSWLASHPPDQVHILVGNHDLVRVCELSAFSDEAFVEARALADAALVDPSKQTSFLQRYPMLASPGVIARDYACFETRQRVLLSRLLQYRRVRLAGAPTNDLLLVHAGVTTDDLALLPAFGEWNARSIAQALNEFLDRQVAEWKGEGPLRLEPLHEMGSAQSGEARGILAHRPANPDSRRTGHDTRQRYDPRSLPPRVTQVIGHISDKKCRELMGAWADQRQVELGVLRGLSLGEPPKYGSGIDDDDRLIFLDGAMSQVAPFEYQVFDLELRRRFVPPLR